LSLGELARKIGVDRNTLSQWERGDRKPHGLHRSIVQNSIRHAVKAKTY